MKKLAVLIVLVVCSSVAFAGGAKVEVRHAPPGDPSNAQTIVVSENAVKAHLDHGDELGECPDGTCTQADDCDDGNL